MIRIFIADDHPLIRKGLKEIFEEEDDMKIVGNASSANEALSEIDKSKPDVLVTDLSMPGRSGLDLINDLKRLFPKLPVLILTMHPEERFAVRALKTGAFGYLTKDTSPEELVKAVRKIATGGKYITPTLAEKLAMELDRELGRMPHEDLSDREFQIMRMIARGIKVSEIAKELSISTRTVATYRLRILSKMNLKSNADIVLYAHDNQLLE